MADRVTVVFAVYGALKVETFAEEGHAVDRLMTKSEDVTDILQTLLDKSSVVEINNANMGGDPADDVEKHFAAIVEYNNVRHPYACQEGQTIDFLKPIGVPP
jgi:hypothetical protein